MWKSVWKTHYLSTHSKPMTARCANPDSFESILTQFSTILLREKI